jgi:hypothetical protein
VPEKDRIKMLKGWYDEGGVLIMGYEMFRLMTGDPDKKVILFDIYILSMYISILDLCFYIFCL